jgi:hypothetical protein
VTEEQISPELVLVDPELRERARADLPWGPPEVPRAARPPAPSTAAPAAGLERPARRLTIATTLWVVGAVSVIVTLALGLLPDRGPRPSLAPALARSPVTTAPVSTPAPEPVPPPAPARTRPRSAQPPAAAPPSPPPAAEPRVQPPPPSQRGVQPPPAAQPKAKAKPQPKPKAKARARPQSPPPATAQPQPAPKPKPTQKPARPSTEPGTAPPTLRSPPPASRGAYQPARVFAWAPERGASYYHVVIRRDGKVFYEGWPRAARLEVPASHRFRPGKYTWRVEPGRGARAAKRLGAPIVESNFTIPG